MQEKSVRARFALCCVVLIGVALILSGCSTPIGVVCGTTQEIHYGLTANVISAGELSSWSSQVLQRNNLSERFKAEPEATLNELRKILAQTPSEERLQVRLFALAELSFLHAEKTGRSEHYLAATLYAYAFLFPEKGNQPDPLDPRVRVAADLYNLGITKGLASPDGQEVTIKAATLALPFGALTLMFTLNGLLMSVFNDQTVLALPMLGAGIAADILLWQRGRLSGKPSADQRMRFSLFAFIVPVLLYALYFLALQMTQGIEWTIHLWLGSIFMAGIIGLFVSFLTVSPLSTARGNVH